MGRDRSRFSGHIPAGQKPDAGGYQARDGGSVSRLAKTGQIPLLPVATVAARLPPTCPRDGERTQQTGGKPWEGPASPGGKPPEPHAGRRARRSARFWGCEAGWAVPLRDGRPLPGDLGGSFKVSPAADPPER